MRTFEEIFEIFEEPSKKYDSIFPKKSAVSLKSALVRLNPNVWQRYTDVSIKSINNGLLYWSDFVSFPNILLCALYPVLPLEKKYRNVLAKNRWYYYVILNSVVEVRRIFVNFSN